MDKSQVQRLLLFVALSLMIMQLTSWWTRRNAPPAPAPAELREGAARSDRAATTTLTQALQPAPQATPAPAEPRPPADELTLTTPQFEVVFSTAGAVPVRWDIIDPEYVTPRSPDDLAAINRDAPLVPEGHEPLIDPRLAHQGDYPLPFELVLREMGQSYLNELNSDVYTHEPVREEGFTGYRFTSPLVEPGVRVAKTFLLAEQGFAGRLRIQVTNESQFSLTFDSGTGGLGVTLGPGLGLPFDDDNPIARFASVSAVAQTEQEFFYYKMKEPGESQALNTPSLRWGGVASMYYLISLIPDGQTPVTTFKSMIPSELARFIPPQRQKEHLPYYPAAEIYTPPFDLGPGQQFTAGFDLFAGPRQHKVLEQAGHDLDRVMFYDSTRVMRGLCLILMRLLDWFHGLVANWGMAIILLTVFVKLVTFPLVHKGLKSQAKMTAEMNRIKPLIDKLNEKYKDNPQKKQQEMFKLYREHGVNPLGMFKGCIWMAIQIPIFYALYRLLYQSIDLRGASFLWVADLSRPDMLFRLPVALPFIGEWFNLLPLITAASQMAMSKFMTTPPTDPQQAQMQKTMMYFMPVIILFITYRFPSGLMLYWLVSNLWQVLQQVWVNKHIRKPPQASAHAPARASS